MPYNYYTIMGEIHNNQAAEVGRNLAVLSYDSTANVPSHFGAPFTEPATPCYNPYYEACLQEDLPIEFSSNGYSNIGSHFQLDKTLGLEGNPFMDPVLSQDLLNNDRHSPNSTTASQMRSETHLLPFSSDMPADEPVPPVVLTTRGYANSPYCDVSITGRAVMPKNATTWLASAIYCSSTGPGTPSRTSSVGVSVEIAHPNEPLKLIHPWYNASTRAAATHISPRGPAASLGYYMNGTLSSSTALTEASPQPVFTIRDLDQENSSSLSSMNTLKANQPQAIDNSGHDELKCAMPIETPSSHPPVSVTGRNLEYGYSKCPWAGCSTVKKGRYQKSNMRNHVRVAHEKPAPPVCELCGKGYKQNESLKRHLLGHEHRFDLPDPVRTVRKTRANGTMYTTYQ